MLVMHVITCLCDVLGQPKLEIEFASCDCVTKPTGYLIEPCFSESSTTIPLIYGPQLLCSYLLQGQEINHLIACQPTARKAVRLQALLPVKPRYKMPSAKMDKLSVFPLHQFTFLLIDSHFLLSSSHCCLLFSAPVFKPSSTIPPTCSQCECKRDFRLFLFTSNGSRVDALLKVQANSSSICDKIGALV